MKEAVLQVPDRVNKCSWRYSSRKDQKPQCNWFKLGWLFSKQMSSFPRKGAALNLGNILVKRFWWILLGPPAHSGQRFQNRTRHAILPPFQNFWRCDGTSEPSVFCYTEFFEFMKPLFRFLNQIVTKLIKFMGKPLSLPLCGLHQTYAKPSNFKIFSIYISSIRFHASHITVQSSSDLFK